MEYIISHHGIRGQKWGIRNYQNPDGSLTEEGRERYYGSSSNDPYIDKDGNKTRLGRNRAKYQNEDSTLTEKGERRLSGLIETANKKNMSEKAFEEASKKLLDDISSDADKKTIKDILSKLSTKYSNEVYTKADRKGNILSEESKKILDQIVQKHNISNSYELFNVASKQYGLNLNEMNRIAMKKSRRDYNANNGLIGGTYGGAMKYLIRKKDGYTIYTYKDMLLDIADTYTKAENKD